MFYIYDTYANRLPLCSTNIKLLDNLFGTNGTVDTVYAHYRLTPNDREANVISNCYVETLM